MDKFETTTERHLEEARQRGRAEMRDEILEILRNSSVRNMQIQLLVIRLEEME